MDDTPWIEANAAAAARHGALSLRDARAAGVASSTYYGRTERDGSVRVERGVVVPAAVRRDFLTTAGAVVASVGGRVALTGVTALHLHGVIEEPPAGVQVAVPADRARPTLRAADDIVRTRTLSVADIVDRDGLPVLTPAWALLHAGRTESRRRIMALYIRALQRGFLRHADVDDVLDRCGRPPGRAALVAARKRLLADDVDSLFELEVRGLLRAHGLSPEPTPFPFRCPDGRVIHLDVPFPQAWFAIECESLGSHPRDEAFDTDRVRWSQAQAGGWTLSFVTPQRLARTPEAILGEVRAALAAADPSRPPPRPAPCRQARCRICPPLRQG